MVSLLVFGYRFHGQTRLLPTLESAAQRVYLGEAAIFQLSRQTGAGFFAASSAVGHKRAIPRQALQSAGKFSSRKMNCARHL